MIEFLTYDLKVAVLLAVFYMFYRLMLARETFHRVNRLVLLLTALASFVLPLCVITIHETVVMAAPQSTIDFGPIAVTPELQPDTAYPVWQSVAVVLFLVGMMATLAHTLWSLFRILSLIRKSEKHPQNDGTIICVTGNTDMAPFSWMCFIVMNRSDFEEQNAAILTHERGHIRLHHSWDLLLVDTLTALQWFNPAIWMLRSDLRAIHEYEADGAVLSQGINARQYQYLLITKAASIGGYSLANGISHSTLKNRINMMLHKKSNPTRLLKLLAFVPIVAITLAVNAETVQDVVFTQPQKRIVKKGKVNKTLRIGNQSLVIVEDTTTKEETQVQKSIETPSTDDCKLIEPIEEMPQFPGGTQKLFEYLSANVRYPKEAEDKCLQGRVVTTFVVEKDGSITDAKIVRGIDPALDAEALRVVNSMPNWIPGKQDGEPVRVKYTIPITFHLVGGETTPTDNEHKVNQTDGSVVVGNTADKGKVLAYTIGSISARNGIGTENPPLVIVDGTAIDFDKINEVKPKSIDHIEILKSKSAIEKYGEKAKNGVIIITTKK